MNREIKFRAIDTLTGKMVYGDFTHGKKVTLTGCEPRIMVGGYEVIPETVGQFTGLLDKNKNEIYEHDLIQDEEGVIYEIWYSEEKACFMAEMVNPQNDMVDILGCYDTERCFEIIGNKFDNPELLKGGDQ